MKRLTQLVTGLPVLCMLLGFNIAGAQEIKQQKSGIEIIKVRHEPAKAGIIIIFSMKAADNLLVRVTNAEGETMFLDNQYGFKGKYSKTVPLGVLARGTYTVEISRESEEIIKNVEVVSALGF